RLARDRESEAAQVIVLIVVAVPAAVVLSKLEREDGALFKLDRLFEYKHGLSRYVATARTDIDAPGGVVFAVDRVLNSPGDALLPRLVVEDCFERLVRRVHVGGGPDDLHFFVLLRMIGRRGQRSEFR